MDKVTIIVPVYNVAPHLKRCVDSLTGQTYPNLEILLVDDGSKDGSPTIMEACAKEDSRVRALYQPENQGVSAARNRGLDEATGDWICFCDGDDWYLPDAIQSLIDCAHCENADHVLFSSQLTYDNRPPRIINDTAAFSSDENTRHLIACGSLSSGMRMVRRQLYLDHAVRFPDGIAHFEELPVVPVLLAHSKKIAAVHEPFYCYYQRGNGTSASNFSGSVEKEFCTVLELTTRALGDAYAPELEARAIYALFYGEILNLCKQGAASKVIRERISRYQKMFPNYRKNPYYHSLSRSKQVFLLLEQVRCIPGLRLLARIHSHFVK